MEVQEKKQRRVECAGHRKGMVPIERLTAMVCENHTDSCLPCQNGTANNLQTHWWRKEMGAALPARCRQLTPEPMPTPPRMPPALASAMKNVKVPKSTVCLPDMRIYKLLFPTLIFSILMHMPRIASAIKILFQICGLMREHPLVSTLSAVW